MRRVDNVVMSRRRGWLIGVSAASLGVYGYDLSNIAGALLFITDEFGLTTRQQELVTTAGLPSTATDVPTCR